MNIVYSIDKNVYMLALVSFLSLLVNNKKSEINLYILNSDLPNFIFQKFEKLKKVKDFNLISIKINPEEFSGLPVGWLTPETWFRLKLADVLPNEERALYLDCDTMFRGDISEIYNMPLGDKYVAVREEGNFEMIPYLNLQSGWYFNTGVILCNLAAWRKNDLEKQLLENALKYKDILKFMDQDVINITCDSSKIKLKRSDVYLTWHSDDKDEHKIVHFIGPKPNSYNCINKKYQKEWWHYAKQTPVFYDICLKYIKENATEYLKLLFSFSKKENKYIFYFLGIKISFKAR